MTLNTTGQSAPPRYIAVATVDTLPDGGMLRVMLESHALVLARRGNAIYAFQGMCPHEKADLSQGRIEEGRLVCPRHLASFALDDGAVSAGWRNVAALKLYPARITGDAIEVDANAVNRNPPGGNRQVWDLSAR
ncbi:MAG: Rieske 2Fe-2S domain-containing protein [Rhodopseudomonas sp.]|nr:Rieske 2Fe-2S domain-containing protein [Rhodopseudomonas sp.]